MRAFCAIPLDDALRVRIAAVPREIGMRGYRLVPAAQMHLTLRFLGEIDEEILPALARALEDACARNAPFDLDVGGGGSFGNPRHPNVVWVGVDDRGGRLAQLHDDVERALVAAGVAPEDRPYHPHITLGRAKGRVSVNRQKLSSLSQVGAIHVDRVNLYRSITAPAGAIHSVLVEARLRG